MMKQRQRQQQQKLLKEAQAQAQQAQEATSNSYNIDYSNDYSDFVYQNLDPNDDVALGGSATGSNPTGFSGAASSTGGAMSAALRQRQRFLARRRLLRQQMMMQKRLGGENADVIERSRSGYGHSGPVYIQSYDEPSCDTGLNPVLALATLAGAALAAYFIFIKVTGGGRKRSFAETFFGVENPDWENALQHVIIGKQTNKQILTGQFTKKVR